MASGARRNAGIHACGRTRRPFGPPWRPEGRCYRILLRLHLVPAARFPGTGRAVGVDRHLRPVVDHVAAMLAAFGAFQMVRDVLHRREVACAAVRAAFDAAVRRQPSLDGVGELALQERLADSAAEVVPGQHLVEMASPQIVGGLDAGLRAGLFPEVEATVLRPAVEPTAEAIRGQQQRAETAVAARENALEVRGARVMPFEADAPAAELAPQQGLARFGFA